MIVIKELKLDNKQKILCLEQLLKVIVKQLGKVNHHNLRQYDNNQELIHTITGSNDINKDVKKLYLDLFEEARIEYNNKQIRDDRKIDNYFNKIARY